MLKPLIRRKLESLTQLPTIPFVVAEVLQLVESSEVSAVHLANLIEKDQALAAKVLRVANSPFYGFSRKISTIDLAIVVMGIDTLKEILLSLVIQKFYGNIKAELFDIKAFWHYSVFSGACSRLLARKLGYRLVGEAFVAGLMHDIGILILIQFFNRQFKEIRKVQNLQNISLIDAEKVVLDCTHCDIGAWIAERWNLPSQHCLAISNHHSSFIEVKSTTVINNNKNDSLHIEDPEIVEEINFSEVEQPLTIIVAMTEWFAQKMGFKSWSNESKPSNLYLAFQILDELSQHDILQADSAFNLLKKEILEEYQKASVFIEIPGKLVSKEEVE